MTLSHRPNYLYSIISILHLCQGQIDYDSDSCEFEGFLSDKVCPLYNYTVKETADIFSDYDYEDEDPSDRIFGAEVVNSTDDYPWAAAIIFKEKYICGGTLVSKFYVITAAHCFHDKSDTAFNPTEFSVATGLTNWKMSLDTPNIFTSKVKKLYIPEEYKPQNGEMFYNFGDLAVIELEHEAKEGEAITGWYTTQKELTEFSKNGTPCFVVGWGNTETSSPANLRVAQLPLIDHEYCKYLFYMYVPMFVVDPRSQFCTYDPEGKKDVCHGDSGSGLICNNRLTGVSSWSLKCAATNSPSIWTSTASQRDFIFWVMTGRVTPVAKKQKLLGSTIQIFPHLIPSVLG